MKYCTINITKLKKLKTKSQFNYHFKFDERDFPGIKYSKDYVAKWGKRVLVDKWQSDPNTAYSRRVVQRFVDKIQELVRSHT